MWMNVFVMLAFTQLCRIKFFNATVPKTVCDNDVMPSGCKHYAKNGIGRQTPASHMAEPPRSRQNSTKATALKRQLPPIQSGELFDTEQGYATATHDHGGRQQGPMPSDKFTSEEEPQLRQCSQAQQNTWQVCALRCVDADYAAFRLSRSAEAQCDLTTRHMPLRMLIIWHC
jgi:hypothetical protein